MHTQNTNGEIVARINRDVKTGSLHLTWGHLPQNLQGTIVSIFLHPTTGETLFVGESTTWQGDRTLFSQRDLLEPTQIESLRFEFRE